MDVGSPTNRACSEGKEKSTFSLFLAPADGFKCRTEGAAIPAGRRRAAKGGELFYRNGNAVLAVSYAAEGNAFQHDATRELFRGNFFTQSSTYDVFPDGEHFVMLQPADGGSVAPTEGVVILNWFEELERLVPTE